MRKIVNSKFTHHKKLVKKLSIVGSIALFLSMTTTTSFACEVENISYKVKNSDSIYKLAAEHGVTPQEIYDENGITSIKGKTILLPKVENKTVAASKLNARVSPSTKSRIIKKYKKGSVVKVAFIENGWAGILNKGYLSYVNNRYLKLSK
jgi:uncharacterized protein YgiM (DUF1202 family)